MELTLIKTRFENSLNFEFIIALDKVWSRVGEVRTMCGCFLIRRKKRSMENGVKTGGPMGRKGKTEGNRIDKGMNKEGTITSRCKFGRGVIEMEVFTLKPDLVTRLVGRKGLVIAPLAMRDILSGNDVFTELGDKIKTSLDSGESRWR